MPNPVLRAGVTAILGLSLVLCSSHEAARAVELFSRPIHLVVGFAAGGPTDVLARVVGARLGTILGKSVVVENRTGASGNIASAAVASSQNDGTTLLVAPLAFAVNESLFPGRGFEYDKNFVAVAPLAETSNVLLVNPSLNVTSVAELIALAKSQDLLYATAGKGTATHLAGELFGMMAGIRMTPVHYRGGGDLLKDVLSGELMITFSTIPPVRDFVRKGSLRGLATTGLERDRVLPNLPTVAESGLAGYDVRLWVGLLAPAGTSREVVAGLSQACAEAIATSDVTSALATEGFTPLTGTPASFDALVRSEIEKWRRVTKAMGTMDN